MGQEVKLEQIKFDRHNANKGSVRGRGQIEASLREFGFADAGTLDKNNTIIGGNKRTEVAGEIGMDEAIIVDVDGTKPVFIRRKDLSLDDPDDDRARRLAYALNRSQEVSLAWDAEVLLADMQSGVDFTGIFDQSELDALLAGLVEDEPVQDPGPQIDKAGELRQKWGVELGQLWQCGAHRIICGDSTDRATVERLLQGEKPFMMVTDPPYGVEYDPHWRDNVVGEFGTRTARGNAAENDYLVDWSAAYSLFDGDVAYVWHAGKFSSVVQANLESSGFIIRNHIVWAKQYFALSRGDYHWQHEPCWYAVKKGRTSCWCGDRTQSTLWEIASLNPAGRQEERVAHGTQKPLECMARPIRNHGGENDIIYEPFSGSGTTIIACEQLNRQCRAIEISPAYVAVALDRWAAATGQTPVLIDD